MLKFNDKPTEKLRLVVRLETTTYFDKTGVCFKKQLRVLKRKSQLYLHDVLIEAEEINRITNLHAVDDGVYELDWCNISHDYETGYADDWEYVLVPYTEEE